MSVNFNKAECEKALENMRTHAEEILETKQKMANYELVGSPITESGELFTSLENTYSKLVTLIVQVTDNLEQITENFDEQEKLIRDAITNGVEVK